MFSGIKGAPRPSSSHIVHVLFLLNVLCLVDCTLILFRFVWFVFMHVCSLDLSRLIVGTDKLTPVALFIEGRMESFSFMLLITRQLAVG